MFQQLSSSKSETKTRGSKKTSPTLSTRTVSKNSSTMQVDGITKLESSKMLRRTRSMGSIAKAANETTPKKSKAKERRVMSERKRSLRSDSKKDGAKNSISPIIEEPTNNNNKISLVAKKLSSSIENCDVKKILQEQLRIERMIEQEKIDLELARKMDAELNGGRQLRRTGVKRQVTLGYALRPAKKLKV